MSTKSQELRDQARRMRESAERADSNQDRRRELAIADDLDRRVDDIDPRPPTGPASCVHCQGPANTVQRFMPERHLVVVHHRKECPKAQLWRSAGDKPDGYWESVLVQEMCETPDRTRTLEWWKLTNVKD